MALKTNFGLSEGKKGLEWLMNMKFWFSSFQGRDPKLDQKSIYSKKSLYFVNRQSVLKVEAVKKCQ